MLPESDASGLTMGMRSASSRSSKAADCMRPCRARTQFLLPLTVLISPLWAIMRQGWARSQLGNVLVEKREWTIARWLT